MLLPRSSDKQVKVWIVLGLFSFTGFYLLHQQPGGVLHLLTQSGLRNKDAAIATSNQPTFGGDFDSKPLQYLCGNTTWTPGLVFQCESPHGGVANVQNFYMTSAFIVPKIRSRSFSDIRVNGLVDFSYLFDRAHFTTTLAEACPQMKLYDSANDLYMFPTTANPIQLNPQDLSSELDYNQVLKEPAKWRVAFDVYLRSVTRGGLSASSPYIVQLHNLVFEFPTSYDHPSITRNFGRLFRFREDTRRLAIVALLEISRKLSVDIKPTSQIPPHAFLGAYISTGLDEAKATWTAYKDQAPSFLAAAASHNLTTIYAASASPQDITLFRTDAARPPHNNYTVLTKEDLLSGADLEALHRLSWDQQSEVDFEILLRSSIFVGIEKSALAWNLALKRHLLSRKLDYTYQEQAMEDEFSVIYGPKTSGYFPLAMWP